MVLNYVRKFNHIKPLWFANVANNILWWTFVKACWRAVGSTMGKGITFKTTLKGRGMLIANSIGDLWMPTLCFLGLLASLGAAPSAVPCSSSKHASPTVVQSRAYRCLRVFP